MQGFMQLSKFWWMAVAGREKHTGFEQELRNIKKKLLFIIKIKHISMIQKYFLKISNSLSYHFLRKSAAHLIHFSIIFSTRSTVWFFDCIRQCRHIHTPRNFVARGILIMFLTGPSVCPLVFFSLFCVCVCFFFCQRNSY